MTLKEELEILRGEPIAIRLPADQIPCIETSDAEKLCKNPVVSVHMITYNHEPYIRQAIEGVMMQQTDFEFELIIGEDCSQDKTREICFEYQKKYPGKIRVLWSESNVYHLGGNSTRVAARCRGEYVAFCEGDDYWTDPHKLQKQVDIMRQHPDVGLCFTDGISVSITDDWKQKWSDYPFASWFTPNQVLDFKQYAKEICIGRPELRKKNCFPFFLTATALVRTHVLNLSKQKYDIFNWRLTLGDLTCWLGVVSLSSVYYLPIFSVERHVLPTGAQSVGANRVFRDGFLVRYYFAKENWNLSFSELSNKHRHLLWSFIAGYMKNKRSSEQRTYAKFIFQLSFIRKELLNPFYLFLFLALRIGHFKNWMGRIWSSLHYRCFIR